MTKLLGMDDRTLARGMALTANWLRAAVFSGKVTDGTRRLKLNNKQARLLRLLFSSPPTGQHLHWSNHHVRGASERAMIDAFLDDLEQHPDRERWLGTFAWDDGITSEDAGAVNLSTLKMKVYKALRSYGLEGIGILEVDTTTPIVGRGKLLLFHVHVYCWSEAGLRFRPRKAASELMEGRRFPNSLGAPSVHFKRVNLHEISVARIAAYFTKSPPGAKNRIGRRHKPGSHFFRSTLAGFTPASALRLAEIFSMVDAREMVFSVGANGRKLRQSWYENFMSHYRSRPGQRRHEAINVIELWRDILAEKGSGRLQSFEVLPCAGIREG